jgi:processive 1,2-diacylglycerol beta-glucosyltransferase
MSRVLILTAGFGEGHNAAARNLAAAVDETAGTGSAVVADLFALASPRLNELSRHSYLTLINRTPRLWSCVFRLLDRFPPFPRALWVLRKETAVLRRLLEKESPKVVCSTFPAYAFIADSLRARGLLKAPFYNIVTDSLSIHSLWTKPRCDGWFVPNPETASVVAGQGVPAQLIHALGFPVHAYFERHGRELSPPDLAAGARPRVLYMLHSGIRDAEATAGWLLTFTDWELTFAVGRDEGLRSRLQEAARSRRAPTTILSWTDQIPHLLLTHHAIISKAGGATTQEAIAARCPMIVNQIVPGQEEGNYELLRQRGIGAYARTPEEVLVSLQRAFESKGALWSTWRHSLSELARPAAAREIATRLLETT